MMGSEFTITLFLNKYAYRADCPKNIAITASHEQLIEGLQLTCQSEAVPPAVYRWVVFGGSGTVSGSDNNTLTVTSLTSDEVVEFRCTAVNFLQEENQRPCYASTSITVCNGMADGTSTSSSQSGKNTHVDYSRHRAPGHLNSYTYSCIFIVLGARHAPACRTALLSSK